MRQFTGVVRDGEVGERACAEHIAQRLTFGVVGGRDADPVAAGAGIAAVRGHVGMVVAIGYQRHPRQPVLDDAITDYRKEIKNHPENAFVYRQKIVPGCTCNGRDTFGLAPISIANDPTLRQGDIVSNGDNQKAALMPEHGKGMGQHRWPRPDGMGRMQRPRTFGAGT